MPGPWGQLGQRNLWGGGQFPDQGPPRQQFRDYLRAQSPGGDLTRGQQVQGFLQQQPWGEQVQQTPWYQQMQQAPWWGQPGWGQGQQGPPLQAPAWGQQPGWQPPAWGQGGRWGQQGSMQPPFQMPDWGQSGGMQPPWYGALGASDQRQGFGANQNMMSPGGQVRTLPEPGLGSSGSVGLGLQSNMPLRSSLKKNVTQGGM
jgi:hypothetical protein